MTKLSDLFSEDIQDELENSDLAEMLDGKSKVSGKQLIAEGNVHVSRLVHYGMKENLLFELVESYGEYRAEGYPVDKAVENSLSDWAVL